MFPAFLASILILTASPMARGHSQTTAEDAELHLLMQLTGNSSSDRLLQVQNVMRATYTALPKEAHGHLGQESIHYLLHRFFMEKHGWHIKGLESSGTAPELYLETNWMPSYLQNVLQKHAGKTGIDLREVAALAVCLEDLIGLEATGRLSRINQILDMPRNASVDEFKDALGIFMMVFHDGDDFLTLSKTALQENLAYFETHYAFWTDASNFIDDKFQKGVQLTNQGKVDVEKSAPIAQTLDSQFYELNDRQCRDLKKLFVSREEVPGRIRLTTFYNMTEFTDWEFDETPAYLRSLGALEETESGVQRVVTTNYIQSMPNCINSNNLFNICCRNECEGMMAQLERNFAAPMADSEQLLQLVASLPSDTVTAPREIPQSLQERLKQIATIHDGKVPLHGRLFAQWMHHAYPRECPYPHMSGTARPFTANEWMQQQGEQITFQSRGRRQEFVRSICGANGDCATLDSENGLAVNDLPWSTEEELPLTSTHHGDSSEASASSKAYEPSSNLQNLAILLVTLSVLVHMMLDRSGSFAFNVVRGLAMILLTLVTDPVFVIFTLVAGLVIVKGLPYVQQKRALSEVDQHRKLFTKL